jgi:hypothetical protein
MSKRRGYRGKGDDGYNNPTATEALNNVSRSAERRLERAEQDESRGPVGVAELAGRAVLPRAVGEGIGIGRCGRAGVSCP